MPALLHGAAPLAPADLLDDVRRVTAAATNEDRFQMLTAMLRERNVAFSVQPFALDQPIRREPRTEGRNLIVTIGQGVESVVVGAHYDAVRLSDGTLSRGAVDNAASSVVLLHLAEALKSDQLPRQIKLVWFDMEELGLVGSRRYIAAYGTAGLTAMLNLDVNGYGDAILYGRRSAMKGACCAET